MSFRMLARKPVARLFWDFTTGGQSVTTAAWSQVLASSPQPASAMELYNGSSSVLRISTGTAGNEVAGEIPYYVLPGGSSILLPIELSKGKPITIRAVDKTASVGSLIVNLFG